MGGWDSALNPGRVGSPIQEAVWTRQGSDRDPNPSCPSFPLCGLGTPAYIFEKQVSSLGYGNLPEGNVIKVISI